jgi:hypothetical protein
LNHRSSSGYDLSMQQLLCSSEARTHYFQTVTYMTSAGCAGFGADFGNGATAGVGHQRLQKQKVAGDSSAMLHSSGWFALKERLQPPGCT